MEYIRYKNFTGTMSYSIDNKEWFGVLTNIKDPFVQDEFSYKGKTSEGLIKEFHITVDNYIKEKGKK